MTSAKGDPEQLPNVPWGIISVKAQVFAQELTCFVQSIRNTCLLIVRNTCLTHKCLTGSLCIPVLPCVSRHCFVAVQDVLMAATSTFTAVAAARQQPR
jgi:hypothetical protein